ncbi:MAG TPA: GNAT family N-acetyltransferase [Ktedonobacterales bacterium]|nr:GNAT family N-acetyltransferase [Ktedonobacterales bacterium]
MAHIQSLTAAEARDAIDGLTLLLQDAVASGASLGFLDPLEDGMARDYWRSVIAKIEEGTRILLVARAEDGRLVGAAQLDLATMPNGRHRAEVQKVCVLRSARGQGIGRQLMLAIEDTARVAGRTLLVLDTWQGSVAEGLYRKLGYAEVGVIPGFARSSRGTLDATVIFYRMLE